jgi:hypothetical protein
MPVFDTVGLSILNHQIWAINPDLDRLGGVTPDQDSQMIAIFILILLKSDSALGMEA